MDSMFNMAACPPTKVEKYCLFASVVLVTNMLYSYTNQVIYHGVGHIDAYVSGKQQIYNHSIGKMFGVLKQI